MSALTGPPPVGTNPFVRLAADLRLERAAAACTPFPPGETFPSVRRTERFARNPLPALLKAYARYGPVFTMRVFHANVVFAIGPEANHFMTVSGADNFSWRDGHMGDLMPLLGDGLLTIDGEFHRRSRQIMLPAFHRERIAATLATMDGEISVALRDWHDGARIDLYTWTRRLALRIAMRALFGLDPDGPLARRTDAAAEFEHALCYWAADYFLQVLRGPRTPWARMQRARARLDAIIYEEIRARRAGGERGEDILSLLLDATDDEGHTLSERHIRDEVMTLLFAGHDTTTSTIAFLFYELARNPSQRERLVAERDAAVGNREPSAAELMGGALPILDRTIDETLRFYPPAWIGARRSVAEFELCGVRVGAGVPVNYSSWVSHHLPDVWDRPEVFRPDRFLPEERSQLPKGAYIPFGGGSRTCIGMRFGELEMRAIASAVLRRFELVPEAGYRLRIRQMPTIGPRDGLPVTVRERR